MAGLGRNLIRFSIRSSKKGSPSPRCPSTSRREGISSNRQQRGDRIHRKAKTGTGKGKAVACVAAALGELRVEIDVDAKFGGLAEEGEIAGIVRCGVSVIRVGVP